MNTLKASDIKNINVDTEFGFAYAEGESEHSNLFQVCLMNIDGEYIEKIDSSDDGYDDGICGEYNNSLGYDNLEECHNAFIAACLNSGVLIKGMNNSKIVSDITNLVEQQKQGLINSGLSASDVETIVFSENDVVEKYLRENEINEDDVDLESLRDLQYSIVDYFK